MERLPDREDFDDIFTRIVDKSTTRRCGNCDLCCSAMEVFDLDPPKKLGERCPHQKTTCPGCRIYDTRPHTCKVFFCVWRSGEIVGINVPDKLYPADCGFVIHYDPTRLQTDERLIATVFIDPQRPNEWRKYRRELATIARLNNIMIAIGGGDTAFDLVTPKGNWFPRHEYPFLYYGIMVGAPKEEFFDRPQGGVLTFDLDKETVHYERAR